MYDEKQASISYIPRDDEGREMLKNAINVISDIIQFVPSTIVVKHNVLKCVVSITGVGTNQYNTGVYLFNKKDDIYPYPINRKTIDYLYNNKEKLKSINSELVVAITGEKLSFSINEDEFTFETNNENNNDYKKPKLCRNQVFPYDQNSNMFILSKNKINGIDTLEWIEKTDRTKNKKEEIAIINKSRSCDNINVTCISKYIFVFNETTKFKEPFRSFNRIHKEFFFENNWGIFNIL